MGRERGQRDAFDLVVVGGGLASARALPAFREHGGDGSVLLVSADTELPYHRPPLSKGYLRGETGRESVFVEPLSRYEELDVELALATRAERVDPGGHRLVLAGGREVGYGRLLVATGGVPRRLDVPGGDLDRVFTLRFLDDADAIRAAAAGAERALVVGGSFIGVEAAASLRARGLDVTLVHRGEHLHDALRCPEFSEALAGLLESNGVQLVLADEVERLEGDGGVRSAGLASGGRVEADLVLAGIGVEPSVALLEGSGIPLDDGVVVDASYAAGAPDVFAAGDVARFPDPVAGRSRRIEHWSNANYQGGEVGKVLAGAGGGYDRVASFFSDVFDLSFTVLGDTAPADEVIVRGSFGDGAAAALYLADGALCGALLVAQDDETSDAAEELIAGRAAVGDRTAAADADVSLTDAFAPARA